MSKLRLHHDEDGMALMTALLAIVILSGLVLVFMNRAVTETRASGHSRDHETSIHVAESAADNQISYLNADDDHVTKDRAGDPIEMDADDLADEKAWVLKLRDADQVGIEDDAWVESGTGQAYAVRPYDADTGEPLKVLYAVGAVPSFDAPDPRIRVLKLQIDQDDFIPEFALMTDGPLKFGGSAAIKVPPNPGPPVKPGCDTTTAESTQATCIADVHTNGTFTQSGGASTIQGRVSQSEGSCPGSVTAVNGCVDAGDGVEDKPIPEFTARNYYNRGDELNKDPESQDVEWFDLCPPGKPVAHASVRRPVTGGPCSDSSPANQVWPDPSEPPTNFRGWKWQANQWQGSEVGAGVFYVYHADAKVTGTNGTMQRAVSIFVEQDPANEAKSGSLDLSGNPRMQSAVDSVLFLTDADLDMHGNTSAGECGVLPGAYSGFVGVGEQLKTQGTVELRGAIIVRDKSDDHGLVSRTNDGVGGTMCLEFDPTLSVNFTGIWVITFWNEL